jgi:hypothetical protein
VHRLTVFAVCALSLALCCGLAWWQWERFSSANGTFQNLGYVLQWPLFGLFPAFMFWRIRHLRIQENSASARSETPPESTPPESTRPESRLVSGVPRPVKLADGPAYPSSTRAGQALAVVDEQDAELAAYNQYLARLNAQDHETR